jgi:Carboxypeptidase regulatory-like domain
MNYTRNYKNGPKRSFRYIRHILVVLLLTISGALLVQSYSGAIRGTITDSSNAAIAGAQVTLTDEATHQTRSTQSDSIGGYALTHSRQQLILCGSLRSLLVMQNAVTLFFPPGFPDARYSTCRWQHQ